MVYLSILEGVPTKPNNYYVWAENKIAHQVALVYVVLLQYLVRSTFAVLQYGVKCTYIVFLIIFDFQYVQICQMNYLNGTVS